MTTTSELRHKIERQGEEISQIARRIENRFEHYTDWRGTVQERPLQSVGVAVGLGVLLSGVALPLLRWSGRQTFGLAQAGLMAFLTAKARNKLLHEGDGHHHRHARI